MGMELKTLIEADHIPMDATVKISIVCPDGVDRAFTLQYGELEALVLEYFTTGRAFKTDGVFANPPVLPPTNGDTALLDGLAKIEDEAAASATAFNNAADAVEGMLDARQRLDRVIAKGIASSS